MNALINRFLKEEDGVTAVEYGLIAGLMAAALVLSVTVLSGGIGNAFSYIATKLNNLGATGS